MILGVFDDFDHSAPVFPGLHCRYRLVGSLGTKTLILLEEIRDDVHGVVLIIGRVEEQKRLVPEGQEEKTCGTLEVHVWDLKGLVAFWCPERLDLLELGDGIVDVKAFEGK
jgi:hypothetical protein